MDHDEPEKDKDMETKLVQALAKRGKLKDLPAYLVGAAEAGAVTNGDLKRIQAIAKLPAGLGRLLILSRPLLERALGNPRFLFALLAELALGLATRATTGRGDAGGRAATLAAGAVGDVSMVCLLSPLKSLGGSGTAASGLAALPAFALQAGAFSPVQRVAALAYKTVAFACIGAALSVATVRGNLLDVAKEGGLSLAAATHARYQIVSAVEERICMGVPALGTAQKSAILVLRAGGAFLSNSGVVALP